MTNRKQVIVVGAGPAGIVAAIAARKHGLRATVLDARTPPIDKPCGEGILPQGVAALKMLGISLPAESAFPFRGIRFIDETNSARAEFAEGTGVALRRVKLHEFLVNQGIEAGVEFRWGVRVARIQEHAVATARETLSFDWLVGADGQNSQVREWMGLRPRFARRKRFGFCSHFQIEPWSDVVEVHWAPGCEIFITPLAGKETGVAVLSRDPHLRIQEALTRFPAVAAKLRGVSLTTRESGDSTNLRILSSVTRGRMALVGDASGTVDAVTGHGLSLSFQQAVELAQAMERGDLAGYESAHKTISSVGVAMTRLMLLMDRSNWIRRRTIRLFQKNPSLFSRMLTIHTGETPLSSVGAAELADFGWKFLQA